MDKNLGHATAYGYAKSKGYTGTEEEFAELMASYATVAESAAASAAAAAESATTAGAAEASAVAAKTAAETASGTATTKASEASASASSAASSATTASGASTTATAKAAEASTAAQTATTKASEASASATAAGTAQTAAETAQTAAESAADRAETAAETFTTDTTLTIAGKAADAKATGDKIRNALPIDTVSGAIASFPDGSNLFPAESCKVSIEPVQAGTGAPAPDNVRPISGWDGVNVAKAGKNLFDFDTVYGRYKQVDGSYRASAGTITLIHANIPQVLVGKTLTFSALVKSSDSTATNIRVAAVVNGVETKGNPVNTTYYQLTSVTFTPTSTADYIRITYGSGGTGYVDARDLQLEEGSTATPYEPYAGSTISVTFPTEVGTVYGGTLDVVSGDLVVDMAMIASYNGETLPGEWISDRDVYAPGTTPTAGAQVVYKLAQPITYHLTPHEVSILLGENNVWADAGDTAVTYRADIQRYIEKKLAAIEALILEN